MNYVRFNQQGGYPLTQETLAFMQENFREITHALGFLTQGFPARLQGAELTVQGGTASISAGYILGGDVFKSQYADLEDGGYSNHLIRVEAQSVPVGSGDPKLVVVPQADATLEPVQYANGDTPEVHWRLKGILTYKPAVLPALKVYDLNTMQDWAFLLSLLLQPQLENPQFADYVETQLKQGTFASWLQTQLENASFANWMQEQLENPQFASYVEDYLVGNWVTVGSGNLAWGSNIQGNISSSDVEIRTLPGGRVELQGQLSLSQSLSAIKGQQPGDDMIVDLFSLPSYLRPADVFNATTYVADPSNSNILNVNIPCQITVGNVVQAKLYLSAPFAQDMDRIQFQHTWST
jgi:hypothetical protein